MDFSTHQKPQAIYDYLAAASPNLKDPDSGYTRLAAGYLLGIGTYYEQQTVRQPGQEDCPSCTLENVLATVLHHDFKHVLAMLKTEPLSAALVPSFLEAHHQGADKQLAGVVAFTQLLLSGLSPGTLASERVSKHLYQFPSIS
jgi:hypothetical protein